jgi:RNA polymerase sigma-70 factor (ECF subfamily)
LRFFAQQSGDPALAEDLAQETLVHILRGLPGFRAAAALRTWARRIALNVWYDHLRCRGARPAARASEGGELSGEVLLDRLGRTSPTPLPDEAFDRRATQHCLVDAVRQLSPAERGVILLRDFGDIPLEEAARTLGCSVGAAKARLHRARRHLAEVCRRECLNEDGRDGATFCTPKGDFASG